VQRKAEGIPLDQPVTHEVILAGKQLASLGLENEVAREREEFHQIGPQQKGNCLLFQLGEGPLWIRLDKDVHFALIGRKTVNHAVARGAGFRLLA
jgi:hypothetical protein